MTTPTPFTPVHDPDKTQVLDRFQRPLQIGDLVQMATVYWRVAALTPSLDPRVPPGTVVLTLTAVQSSVVQAGQPLGDLLKVIDAADMPPLPGSERETQNGEGSPANGTRRSGLTVVQ